MIRRSNDPLTFGDVDGIVLNEQAPASSIAGVSANVAILVGQAQRGPSNLTLITGLDMVHEVYGKDSAMGLNKVLKNKIFSALKFIRVVADDAVKAALTVKDGAEEAPANIIKFTAKFVGAYGNKISVKIEAGTDAGTKKYTFADTNAGSVIAIEVYDNVKVAEISPETFANSKLVDVEVLAATAEPVNTTAVLTSGSDGTVADTDYEAAIAKAGVLGAGNVIFLDEYNAIRNGYLKTHVAEFQDKMAICGSTAEDATEAQTEAATLRDVDGRIVLAFNDVKTVVDGVEVTQPFAWYVACLFTNVAAHIDLAYFENSRWLAGITGMVHQLSHNEYVALNKAGVCALMYDPDLGFKIKSAVTTQIAVTDKQLITRRRMTDYLQDSIAKYLKVYVNKVNSKGTRTAIKAGITQFDDQLIAAGVLPSDAEMSDGAKARLIDTESQNNNESIALGFLKIVYKRRLFNSARYIVLTTEIGQSVSVTEG